ncbi:MAG: hypothetical protein K6C94_02055 [Candidatus Gastranaerophilales bacterium]|nr:hypothetical protein [Candidatus Gastranaerophilales bacterium]
MIRYTDNNENEILLSKKIDKGGEAEIYKIAGADNLIAKIYNDSHLIDNQKHSKLRRMLELYDYDIAEFYAWPLKIIYSGNSAVGFVMENINSNNRNGSKYIKFINFYNWKDRRKYFPNADYLFLVNAAINLTISIETMHEKGFVVGDINESNVFINNKDATVKLLDCDSYQIEDYLCGVGKPEYTAPELPNTLRNTVRTKNHDYFALAIMIFLILVGKHPYIGQNTSLDKIRQSVTDGLYCYGQNAEDKNLSSFYPFTEVYNSLNLEIKKLFDRAFNTTNRPTTQEWRNALTKYKKQLVECSHNENHVYNYKYNSCVWCDIEKNGYVAFNSENIQNQSNNYNYRTQTSSQTSSKSYSQSSSSGNIRQNYSTSSYTTTNSYTPSSAELQSLAVIIKTIVFIIMAVIIFSFINGIRENVTKENISANENYLLTTENNTEENLYPECASEYILSLITKERTAQLLTLIENSGLSSLNNDFSLEYRLSATDSENGTCYGEEVINNLFNFDNEVKLVLPINYKTYYEEGNPRIEQDGYNDNFDAVLQSGSFYKRENKVSDEEFNEIYGQINSQQPNNEETEEPLTNEKEEQTQTTAPQQNPQKHEYILLKTEEILPAQTNTNSENTTEAPIPAFQTIPQKFDLQKSADEFYEGIK